MSARNASRYGDKPAFVLGETTVTFAEHNRRANRLVRGLRGLGVRRGDRVSVLARNCLEYLDAYAAAEKGGFVLAPLNFRLTAADLAPVVERLQPRVVLAQPDYVDVVDAVRDELGPAVLVTLGEHAGGGWRTLASVVDGASDDEPTATIRPDDVCYLISTSGTTGLPRAAMLTHEGQFLDALTLAVEMGVHAVDRHLAMMPLYHVGGRAIVLAHQLRGCTVVLHDGFDTAAVLRDVERHAITTTQVVPTMVAWLLDSSELDDADLSSLRLIWYASAPMPTELLRRALGRFGPVFMQGYGQTESGPLVTTLPTWEHVVDDPRADHLRSCGRAVPGVDVRIVDEDGRPVAVGEVGEVAVHSPFAMAGYWEDAAATGHALRDGWLHTADMGRLDEAGYLYLVDRKKDLIISGGENIYPREIEEVLYAHPAVREAAVVGVPDEVWGESVLAVVVPREGAEANGDELIAYCKERLASYKCPKRVDFRDAVPMTPSGKILKRALREPYWREPTEA